MNTRWRLAHARGYLSLGLVEEAAAELSEVPESAEPVLEIMALRAHVLQEQSRWQELQEIAHDLVRREPAEPGWWVTWAYATRRSHSLAAAEAILREAEALHRAEATIQFNLGCYACLRGDLGEARDRVLRACTLDGKFHAIAAADPDLAALRDSGWRPPSALV